MYRDLPRDHYARLSKYRDAVATCLILDPSLVDGHYVSQIPTDGCSGHVLGDVLTVCKVYRRDPTKALIEMIESHEIIRLVHLANQGVFWRWYSEYYARALNYLNQVERSYFSLVNVDPKMFG